MKKIVTKVDDMLKAWTKADDAARIEGVKRLGLPENNTALDRAKAMGFGDDVYHGTKARFDEFVADKDSWSKAFFTTPNPKFANKFASDGLGWNYEKGGSNVLPLKTRAKNIFDYENPKHIEDLIQNNPKIHVGEANGPRYGKVGDGSWTTMESEGVQQGIKDLGFDGFTVKEGGVKNTGIYNNADIRSKFAHFNPKYAGIGAGSILSANLMADELDLEHKPKVSIWDSLMNTIGNVNQQQAQSYGDTAVSTAGTIGNLITDPSIAAELGIKGLRGTATGLLLNSGSVEAAEDPNFLNKLQRQQNEIR